MNQKLQIFYHPCKDCKIEYISYIALGTLTISILYRKVLKMTHFQLIAGFGQTLLERQMGKKIITFDFGYIWKQKRLN